jgi:exosortase
VIARWLGAGLVLAGFALHYKGLMWAMGYPKDLSLIVTLFGVVLLSCGWPAARWGWFAVAFLIFALPAPVRLYQQLTLPLRELAASASGFALSMLPGMVALPQGTLVEYIYGDRAGTLDVEQACSGMRLLMTMAALGVAMAFMHERPLWQRLVMMLACVPIAILCNIIRVTVTGLLVVFERDDLARGTTHTLLGMGMLAVAFGLYSALSYVLSHLVVEAEEDVEGNVAASPAIGN